MENREPVLFLAVQTLETVEGERKPLHLFQAVTQCTAESQLIPHACRLTPGVQPDQGKGRYHTAEAIWSMFGEDVITGLKIVE